MEENAVNRINVLCFRIKYLRFTFVTGVDGKVINECGHMGISPAAWKGWGNLSSATVT